MRVWQRMSVIEMKDEWEEPVDSGQEIDELRSDAERGRTEVARERKDKYEEQARRQERYEEEERRPRWAESQ